MFVLVARRFGSGEQLSNEAARLELQVSGEVQIGPALAQLTHVEMADVRIGSHEGGIDGAHGRASKDVERCGVVVREPQGVGDARQHPNLVGTSHASARQYQTYRGFPGHSVAYS